MIKENKNLVKRYTLAYPTSAHKLSSVGGFRNYIKECYCCYIQPTDKDYRDVKGPGSLTATVRHRENSNDLPGFEPTSSANRAQLRFRSSEQFDKIATMGARRPRTHAHPPTSQRGWSRPSVGGSCDAPVAAVAPETNTARYCWPVRSCSTS